MCMCMCVCRVTDQPPTQMALSWMALIHQVTFFPSLPSCVCVCVCTYMFLLHSVAALPHSFFHTLSLSLSLNLSLSTSLTRFIMALIHQVYQTAWYLLINCFMSAHFLPHDSYNASWARLPPQHLQSTATDPATQMQENCALVLTKKNVLSPKSFSHNKMR